VSEPVDFEREYLYGGVGVAGPSLVKEIRSLPVLHQVIACIMLLNICVVMVLASGTVPYILLRWGYGYMMH
jgi:hypothetical protein